MERETLLAMQSDPALFRDHLLVPSAFGPALLGKIVADFQRRDFAVLDAAVLALARGEMPPHRRIWIERTKGGSKDSDAAVSLLWLLMFATRPVRCRIGAADQQQADEVRLIVQQILRMDSPLNAYLDTFIDVQGTRILNKQNGSRADILTADKFGSHGSRPDFTLINELSHIGDQQFAETLFDDADKVRTSVVLVCSNAGHLDTWQYQWHELARTSPRFHFSALTEPAPWIDPVDLEDSQRRNSAARFNRLWRGQWVRNVGNALEEADIEAAITLVSPPAEPQRDPRPFIAALDIGVRRDHSALVVLACDYVNHRVQLAHANSWAPRPQIGVDLEAVRAEAESICTSWPATLLYDPAQCEMIATDLRAKGVNAIPYPFTGPNCHEMANTLVSAFRERRVDLYRHDGLLKSLGRLCIVEKSFGYKLEASHDPIVGHADLAFALAISMTAAMKVATQYNPDAYYEVVAGTLGSGY